VEIDPCVRYDNVDSTEPVGRLLHHRFNISWFPHICAQAKHSHAKVSPNFCHGFIRFSLIPGGDGNTGSCSCKSSRDTFPDPPVPACDNGDFIIQTKKTFY
jgi:hypothetical protein